MKLKPKARKICFIGLISAVLFLGFHIFIIQPVDQTILKDWSAPNQLSEDESTAFFNQLSNLITPIPIGSRQRSAIRALVEGVPINYVGRVIDEDSQAMPGVKVNWWVFDGSGSSRAKYKGVEVTDAQGEFFVNGVVGKKIMLKPSLDGYSFIATNGTIDVAKSELFGEQRGTEYKQRHELVMWRSNGSKFLTEMVFRELLNSKDQMLRLDFILGEEVPRGGDCVITIKRDDGSMSHLEKKNWSISVRPVKGGILAFEEHVLDFLVEAPENGYQTEWTHRSVPDSNEWKYQVTSGFVMRTRGGQCYSRVKLNFIMSREVDEPMYLFMEAVINTNSSRVLIN